MSALRFTVLIDGACPLCRREAELLKRLDAGRGRLALIDIAARDFDPTSFGLGVDVLMARIHGVLPDGSLVEGMEVFRRAYDAVGRGWLLAWTRWPGLRPLCDLAYRLFARHRLSLTGRRHECSSNACARDPRT